MKRVFDIIVSFSGLLLMSPLLLVVMYLVWRQDHKSPFYVASRVGKGARSFKMVKMRSMVINADSTGVDSTSANDARITPVGHFIRRYKIDELTQLWNVLIGNMSLVGPRPNVWNDVRLYTEEEKYILSIRPGITDISSIVFADEGEILKGSDDPDLKYNQVIRPWKSRLGILYAQQKSFKLDLGLIYLTLLSAVSRQSALNGVERLLYQLGADSKVINVAKRASVLEAYPPPGSDSIPQAL